MEEIEELATLSLTTLRVDYRPVTGGGVIVINLILSTQS